jgi:hypothetical protein
VKRLRRPLGEVVGVAVVDARSRPPPAVFTGSNDAGHFGCCEWPRR